MNASKGKLLRMPHGMKLRVFIWLAYLSVALFVLLKSPIFGIVLLVLPILWQVVLLWVKGEAGLTFGPFRQQNSTVFGYAARQLWMASRPIQVGLSLVCVVVVLGGLTWISTENMRAYAAKPTLSEQAAALAETTGDATVEKTKSWLATAKGWFVSDDNGD